eukprot:9270147-Pyramimonas_sp.AAC.1
MCVRKPPRWMITGNHVVDSAASCTAHEARLAAAVKLTIMLHDGRAFLVRMRLSRLFGKPH